MNNTPDGFFRIFLNITMASRTVRPKYPLEVELWLEWGGREDKGMQEWLQHEATFPKIRRTDFN